MQLIVSEEISGRSEGELSALYKRVTQELNKTECGTPERRNALASLETVVTERNARWMMRP